MASIDSPAGDPSLDEFISMRSGDKVNLLRGKLNGGADFEIRDGELIVTDGAIIRSPNAHERKEVFDFLHGKYGKGGRLEWKADKLNFSVSKLGAVAGAVGDALSSVRKKVEKARRNDEQEIRAWGMVSWVRRTSENDPLLSETDLEGLLKAEFKDDFKENEEDLDLFAKEAVKLAKNGPKNTESATRVVAKTDLAKEIAIRLGRAEEEADIRAHFEADTNINTFKNKKGTVIHRAQAELKEILDIAFRQAKALRAEKAKEKAGSLNIKARELGMVSLARYMMEDQGDHETVVRSQLTTTFAGEPNLVDLVDAAIREAQNNGHNENAARVLAVKLKLGAKVAARLARGHKEADIRYDLIREPEVEEALPGTRMRIYRSIREQNEIWAAALAEAKGLQAKEKHNEGELVETAHKQGMVVMARRLIEQGRTTTETKDELIHVFPGDRATVLAEAAVREAVDDEKYKLRLDRYVKDKKLGERVLRDRDAHKTDPAITAELRVDEEVYTNPSGVDFQRSDADLDELIAAAFRQAESLGRSREAAAANKRKEAHQKANRNKLMPGSAEGKWDEEMTRLDAFRLARMRRQEGKSETEIRTELEGLFAGKPDPEAMAIYAAEQSKDSAFNTKLAEKLAFHRSFNEIAKHHIDGGATGGALEALVRPEINSIMNPPGTPQTVSDCEVEDLMRAAIKRAQSEEKWKERGERTETWLKGPGWNLTKKGLKYGAVGTAVLGLGTAATALVASAAALTLGWKGIKMVGRGIETTAAYALPMMGEAARAGVNVAGATLKFARNTLLYAPASMIATPMVRTYQAAKVALNYPDQANYQKPEIKKPANKEAKGWTTPFTWMANGFRSTTTGIGNLFRRTTTGVGNLFRGGWRKSKQAALLAGALLTAPVVGLGEGTAIGVGHHIAGAEWHGSKTIDTFMEENGKPHAAPAAPAAAPAANGKDHAHDKAHAKKDH